MIRSIFISFVFSTILFAEFESDLQLKLILSEPGDTIHLESGLFPILGTLSMEGKENIVIKGSGTNGTILDFSTQIELENLLSYSFSFSSFYLQSYTVAPAHHGAFS